MSPNLLVGELQKHEVMQLVEDIDFYQIESLKAWSIEALNNCGQNDEISSSTTLQSFSIPPAPRHRATTPRIDTTRYIRFIGPDEISISAAIPTEWQAV